PQHLLSPTPRSSPMWMNFCPKCGQAMPKPAAKRQACQHCPFINYNNPVPVTATLIPVGNGAVLVQRKGPPYVGQCRLPRGFIEKDEQPRSHSSPRTTCAAGAAAFGPLSDTQMQEVDAILASMK